MKDKSVIFMGTPLFSVPILENLIKNTNVIGVVTAPDAYVGRKKILTPSPIKELAIKEGIDVFCPTKLKDDYKFIIDKNPDIIITCAYGQIVPEEVLNLPKYGCINIHASLLPKYRGASPIHHAIMNGDEKTGITLMYMAKSLDTGDIIRQDEIKIDTSDNLETLSNKLSNLGSRTIIEELPLIFEGKSNRIKQDDSKSSYVSLIRREEEHLTFNDTSKNIYNKIRAFSPSPYVNFILDDKEYKIVEAVPIEIDVKDAFVKPGIIIAETKNSFIVRTKDEGIMILKIKPIGKNIMNVSDFKNGYHDSLVGKELK